MDELLSHAMQIAAEAASATGASSNETVLRHCLENILEHHCRLLNIPWTSFQLDRSLIQAEGKPRFADAVHGAIITEYESPHHFRGHEGASFRKAKTQAEEYARLIQREEGRPLSEYTLIVWDGSHISFGRFRDNEVEWDPLVSFDWRAALRLLNLLRAKGMPLVHPHLLLQLVGPESPLGSMLIPRLFQAIQAASRGTQMGKTRLLFTEWRRLFGQAVGIQSEHLKKLLRHQEHLHNLPYGDDPAAYLFALNTYIALVAKLVAALSLPGASRNLLDPRVAIYDKVRSLESGHLFSDAGISNMLVGDFFSWYPHDPNWPEFQQGLDALVAQLSGVRFDITHKDPATTRDLFKGMYQTFVPRALRHALGEYYTPDWLASYALDLIGWSPEDSLLDPTCGTGTFLLEALRRRLIVNSGYPVSIRELLVGLYGIDLNPLAVLAARASLLVFLSPYLDPPYPVRLPVLLADAINTAVTEGNICYHTILTEVGPRDFAIPKALVEDEQFYNVMAKIRNLIEAGYDAKRILRALQEEFPLKALSADEQDALQGTIATLVDLYRKGWDTIWTAVLADRFSASVIPQVNYVAGNPPWVKWSNLPPDYAAFIKNRCVQLGVFSEDRWVGGIESDISTIITYEVMDKWLAPHGKMAFFITGTVFTNESSQGFRLFHLRHRCLKAKVLRVEDFSAIAPFEGVANFPTLLVLERDGDTTYPVPYKFWKPSTNRKPPSSTRTLHEWAQVEEVLAMPVPGKEAGPWLKGTREELAIWEKLFGTPIPSYRARKGVTTDCNSVFFVQVLEVFQDRQGTKWCKIRNNPRLGKRSEIPQIEAIIEWEHVFPLLRGRGVRPFQAKPDPEYRILLPQRGMFGDDRLPETARRTYQFLAHFKSVLEQRSSYKRYQRGKPFWSVWTTGPYTFSEYKVLWREVSGGQFFVTYTGKYQDPLLGEKEVIPDHKLYFVPVATEEEAAYLTGFLNAPLIAGAVSAYAAQLSLGTSVVEYLRIPAFEPRNPDHRRIAEIAREIAAANGEHEPEELQELNRLIARALSFIGYLGAGGGP